VVIAWQELDICAALAPGANFPGYCLLRQIETPRGVRVPAIYYVAHQVKLFRVMPSQEVKQGACTAHCSTQMEIRNPNRSIQISGTLACAYACRKPQLHLHCSS